MSGRYPVCRGGEQVAVQERIEATPRRRRDSPQPAPQDSCHESAIVKSLRG